MSEVWVIVDDHVERIDGPLEYRQLPSGETVDEALRPVLVGVHDERGCEGDHCVVHNPSPHPLSTWSLWWQQDRKMFERICQHGVGHPDPDQYAYWAETLPPLELRAKFVHDCCGCCTP
jgi:hypothetical protein